MFEIKSGKRRVTLRTAQGVAAAMFEKAPGAKPLFSLSSVFAF